MKVLITGGAGFIGSHLTRLLLDEENEVVILDDLSTGRIENIERLGAGARCTCHIDTTANPQVVHKLVQQCDVIFHLAASVGVQLIVDRPVETITNNVAGTEVLLRAAAKEKKRTVLTSTSEVYGKRERVPFHEDDDLLLGAPTKRRWSYACSKAVDEFLALAHFEQSGFPVIVTRLFNTVGPGQTGRYGMVVPRFVEQALRNEPITVYGDGTQTRCFAHVTDVVRMLALLAGCDDALGQVVNVGTDEEVSIVDLARRIIELTGSRSRIEHVPYTEAFGHDFEDMQRRLPSVEKLENLVGERPHRNLDTTLRDVIEDKRRELSRRRA